MKELYVLFQYGEVSYWTHDRESALREAKLSVDQYICDHLRHNLPLKATDEIVRRLDVQLFRLTADDLVTLPCQEWFDEYYTSTKNWEKTEEEREYKRFLELYEKYKDRLPE
jgi:ribosomal protein L33